MKVGINNFHDFTPEEEVRYQELVKTSPTGACKNCFTGEIRPMTQAESDEIEQVRDDFESCGIGPKSF